MKVLERQVEKLEDALRDATYDLAEQYRQSHVIPFCDRRGLRFTVGMGSWVFHSLTTDEQHGGIVWPITDGLPKRLLDVLEQSALFGRQCLGSCMVDYTPPNYKAKR